MLTTTTTAIIISIISFLIILLIYLYCRNIRKYLPLLSIELQIPFITVRTVLMKECNYSMEVEYLVLDVRIWRWYFHIKLYDTYKRMNMRISDKYNQIRKEIIKENKL
jgi:hypothetical protein